MLKDAHGVAYSTPSAPALAAYEDVLMGYIRYRADLAARLGKLMETAPDMAMAHVLKGYMMLLACKEAMVPVARAAHARAEELSAGTTSRERAHVAALGAWSGRDLDRAVAIWSDIISEHPTDVLAFRLHHFNSFWLGRPSEMRTAVEAVLPHWNEALPAYGSILACRCFAHEECGSYTIAEAAGRRAVEIDPADVWGTHAIAHVLEMQGRRSEGILWLKKLEPNWEGKSNLVHHLWWHRALYHLEQRETDEVLRLYDTRFRNLASPLTAAQPDLYIDVQNAASMLFRLSRQGVDVGDRWAEIADKAEARVGDCLNPFTLPHWMMALAATGRDAAADRHLAGMRAFAANEKSALGRLVGEIAVPVSAAILAHGRKRHAEALELMRPVLGSMYQLGGSHAQQDVLEQVYLDAALAAGATSDVRLLLERVRGRHPVAPEHRIGYAMATRALN